MYVLWFGGINAFQCLITILKCVHTINNLVCDPLSYQDEKKNKKKE